MAADLPLASPGVRFPPPLLFIGGLLIGWLLERWLYSLAIPALAITRMTGYLLVIGGAALVAWGMLTFRAARTAIIPNRAASRLVERGPYRFTRNPMYTGFTIAYLGGALLIGSVWPLLLLPLVLWVLWRQVIRREEAYLVTAFGADYSAYQSRTPRWL